MNYYNENDEDAANWLQNLVDNMVIPDAVVDRRSIVDVTPGDLKGFDQCHFFAGIGGWPYALMLAGVPSDTPLWTGSCPCQPFSNIGLKKGEADERHLWPVFYNLIKKCKPPTVYGEQVASTDGRAWLSRVFADLEAASYAAAGADLSAAGVTAPHIRQRLYWVGDADYEGLEGHAGDDEGDGRRSSSRGPVAAPSSAVPWDNSVRIAQFEGRSRRCEPGVSPMAYRTPAHVGLLRAYGNAIVPQVAEQFIRAHREARHAA